MTKDWSKYYNLTKNSPPSKLLIAALTYTKRNTGKAIDIGGGALKDTRYLLAQGFEVTVIDGDEQVAGLVEEIQSDQIHSFTSSFAEFEFGENTYDIASAMFSLPFNPPETFDIVLQKIKRCVVKNGIFCGQFFGTGDEWTFNKKMTFHTEEQARNLLSDMELLVFTETEKDSKTADGTPKHWHFFDFIARKV